jgi:hypothetical protein
MPYLSVNRHREANDYPGIVEHIAVFRDTFAKVVIDAYDRKTLIDILLPRSSYEIEALRRGFRVLTNGSDLGVQLRTVLVEGGCSKCLCDSATGLALGPFLFDLWLLDNVPPII